MLYPANISRRARLIGLEMLLGSYIMVLHDKIKTIKNLHVQI